MSYKVFLVAYLGVPRNHHTIFVETNEDGPGTGFMYQVTGDIQNGMVHGHKKGRKPEDSTTFTDKTDLGSVTHSSYPRVRQICDRIDPPKKQFNMNKRLYPQEPVRRCQEWTKEAIQALTEAGVLQSSSAEETAEEDYWTWSDQYSNWYHENSDGTFEWAGNAQAAGDAGQKGEGKSKGSKDHKDKGRGKGKNK